MKNSCLTFLLFIAVFAVQAQKKIQPDSLYRMDKFEPGDDISKYANSISLVSKKDSAKTIRRYLYTGNDVTSYMGYPVKRISLEFCNGILVSVSFHFNDHQAARTKNTFTRIQLGALKNKLVQHFGNAKMHNNTDMAIDEPGRGGLNAESWVWTNKKMFLNLLWMKTVYENGYSAGLSLMDRELRKKCMGK